MLGGVVWLLLYSQIDNFPMKFAYMCYVYKLQILQMHNMENRIYVDIVININFVL